VDAGTTVSMHTERLDDIRISSDDPEAVRRPNGLWQWRESLRTRLRADSLSAGNDGGDLLPGLVVGDTEPQDARMIDDMRVVSLTHISAVSGSNVTIVSLGAGLVAGACRAGPRLRVSIGVLTCIGYVFVVGFEPSAIRAAGMAIAAAVVFLRGGGISPVAVMCATASLLLAFVPVLATSVGFVLSVVSTAAIMFVVPILLRRLAVHLPLVPSVLVAALVVPFVAQLACTPVLVAIDPRIGLCRWPPTPWPRRPFCLPPWPVSSASWARRSRPRACPDPTSSPAVSPGSGPCRRGGSSKSPESAPPCREPHSTGRHRRWALCWLRPCSGGPSSARGCWCAVAGGDCRSSSCASSSPPR